MAAAAQRVMVIDLASDRALTGGVTVVDEDEAEEEDAEMHRQGRAAQSEEVSLMILPRRPRQRDELLALLQARGSAYEMTVDIYLKGEVLEAQRN